MNIDLLAARILTMPIQARLLTLPKVRMLATKNPPIAATATNIAVQAPCVDIAFRLIETLSMAEPATKIQTAILSATGSNAMVAGV